MQLRFRGHDKIKKSFRCYGNGVPIDRTHLEYPLRLQRDRCNNARIKEHPYNDVRDYTPQPHVI